MTPLWLYPATEVSVYSAALSAAILCFSAYVSLIVNTQNAPMMRSAPANTIILSWWRPPNSLKITPPNTAATIWGMVIVPLNNPRYAPMCFPLIELVSMVNGMASIAAHAVPTRK